MKSVLRSLRWRLIIGLSIPLIVFRIATGYLNYNHVRVSVQSLQDMMLSQLIGGVTAIVGSGGPDADLVKIKSSLDFVRDARGGAFQYQVRNENGDFLAGDPTFPNVEPKDPLTLSSVQFHGHYFRTGASRLHPRDWVLTVAQDQTPLETYSHTSWWSLSIIYTFVVVLMVLTVHVVTILSLKTVDELRNQLIKRDMHDLSPIKSDTVPRELEPFIKTLNDLLERVSYDIQTQQNFFELASHQLKTPLAGMRNLLDLARRKNLFDTDPMLLQKIVLCIGRMQSLCEKLLSLSRVTSSKEQFGKRDAVGLISLCKELIVRFVPQAEEKRVDLGFFKASSGTSDVFVRANREALAELFSNLIDNAIRYSPADTNVTVIVSDTPSPTVIVEDEGIGIPPEFRYKVFERFFRVLGSEESGSGLGLSIASKIAEFHQATVEVEDGSNNKGTRIIVRFPENQDPTKTIG